MSERRRIRKVVDYTKYDCDDSDDDDFHVSNPSKRSKTEKQSSNCLLADSTCRTKSDKPTVSSLTSVKNRSGKPKIILPTSSQSSSSSSSSSQSSSTERHSTDKENYRLNAGSNRSRTFDDESSHESLVKGESIYKTSSVETKTKKSFEGVRDSQFESEGDVQIVAENEPTLIIRPTDSFVALTNNCETMGKWTPLGTTPTKREIPVEHGRCIIGTSSGLRIGLSRSAKVKPLHGNVKG